jgi:hypothetical protein
MRLAAMDCAELQMPPMHSTPDTLGRDKSGHTKWWLLVLAVVVLATVAAWKLLPALLIPSASVHYKLSVDIDDNGMVHHGEGVIGVGFQSQGPLLIGNTPQWSTSTNGEAFTINIGDRGDLFVLLAGDEPRNKRNHVEAGDKRVSASAGRGALSVYFNFDVIGLPNGLKSKEKIDALADSEANVELQPSALPLLVRFRDLNDPSSVEVVDPDDLESSFGPGVKVVRSHAEITAEAITSGIQKRLRWLKSGYREKYLFTVPSESESNDAVRQVVTYGDLSSSNK